MRVDLHLHSTASDGSLAPGLLVEAARRGGLDVVALSDHDTAAGVAEALAAAPAGLHVLAAIELSSTHAGSELHFLGYAIDPAAAVLSAFERDAAQRRRERMLGMVRRLAEIGVAIEYDDVLEAAGPGATTLGRAHLARALVRLGHAASVNQVFERWLGDGGPAFLPTELLTPREAIDLVHAAGGRAVWAHPPARLVEPELRRFTGWGLDGVECFRPGAADAHELARRARALNLLVSGGSDWHGEWNGRLGEFWVPASDIPEILEAVR
ncbi:MAG: PHP domain-containing protein [Gemmatimonadetes bacterium]|nr:PHP domain-containing protein [Gemmatimonadota bacterium]